MAGVNTSFSIEDRISIKLESIMDKTSQVVSVTDRATQAVERQAEAQDRAASATQRMATTQETASASASRVSQATQEVSQATDRLAQETAQASESAQRQITINNQVTATIEGWDRGVDALVVSMGLLHGELTRINTQTNRHEANTRKLPPTLKSVGEQAERTGSRVSNMWQKFRGYLFALFAISAVSRALGSLFKAADEYSNIQSRLNLINDGTQTNAELNDKIYKTAQKTRAEYNAMASSVAKLNMLTNGVFANNNESIRFLELMQKSFTISGASAEEQKSAILQLTQAMASGRLQGDELRSISENSPMLLQAIEKYAGISRAELRKMAAEGRISAELIKNSLFASAEDIETKFEQVPMTVAQAWTTFINYLQMRLQPVFKMVQDALKSEGFRQFASVATQAIDMVVVAVQILLTILGKVWSMAYTIGSYFVSNWSTIGPIIMGIAAALAVVYGYLVSMTIIETIRNMWTALNQAVALFNALPYDNPMVAVGLVIIAVITSIMVGFLGLGQTVELVFGVIGMIISGTIAFVQNIFIGAYNLVMTVIWLIVNAFIASVNTISLLWWGFLMLIGTVGEGIANIFIEVINWLSEKWNDFGYFMDQLFYNIGRGVVKMAESAGGVVDGLINAVLGGIEGMINKAIGGINKMIEAVNKIPGVDIGVLSEVALGRSDVAGAAKSWGDSMAEPVKGAAAKLERITGLAQELAGEKAQQMAVWKLPQADLKDMGQAIVDGYNAGAGIGRGMVDGVQGLMDKINGMMGGVQGDPLNPGDPGLGNFDPKAFDPSMLGPVSVKGGKIDKVKEVDVNDEYVKLLKDVAEQKWQQNFITLKPSITNNLEVKDDRDTEDFIAKFNDQLLDAVNNNASSLIGI